MARPILCAGANLAEIESAIFLARLLPVAQYLGEDPPRYEPPEGPGDVLARQFRQGAGWLRCRTTRLLQELMARYERERITSRFPRPPPAVVVLDTR